MAEALAVVGIVANIVQLVDFSSKLLDRLDEFQSNLAEIPKSFRHIKAELPVLRDTLRQTKDAIDAGYVRDETKRALLPAIEGCTVQIDALDIILIKTLPTASDSKLKKGKKAILSLHQDAKVESISKTLRGYTNTLTFYYAAASSTLQPIADEKLAKIRQWLRAQDPSQNYQKALKLRQPDTGMWFLQSSEYSNWETDPASILWLHGIPGCGKTILSSTILESVYRYCANDPGKVVAYFYFDFNDAQKQVSESMVRSLICQLSQQCVVMPTALEIFHRSYESGQRQPSLDALMDVLREIIAEIPRVYIIIDALDECTDRDELMGIVERVAGWRLDSLHLLVTSRKERDIESSLESLVDEGNIICLQSKLVDNDIGRYIHHRLSTDKNLQRWLKDPDIVDEIKTALMNGAQGMFRWAVCQLDILSKCLNRVMLRKSLKDLPRTLDMTYERILRAIDPSLSEYAIRILRWLTFSARPMLIEELSEVISIDPQRHPAINREEILEDPSDILSICSSLVTITTKESSGTRSAAPEKVVALAHYSVKEYLTSERIRNGSIAQYSMQLTTCNEFIAKCCLHYLLQFQEASLVTSEIVQDFKLAQYSANFWITHTKSAEQEEETINSLIVDLFSARDGAFLHWTRMSQLEDTKLGFGTPLYYASLNGLKIIVERLLDDGTDVNAQGGRYCTALQAASYGGYDQIVQQLLDRGAHVDAYGGYYAVALQAASFRGHGQIVQTLLNRGANVNMEGWRFGSALQAASKGGRVQIVQQLLDRGADVNMTGGRHGTALRAASSGRHKQIVQLLLDRGADVNVKVGPRLPEGYN